MLEIDGISVNVIWKSKLSYKQFISFQSTKHFQFVIVTKKNKIRLIKLEQLSVWSLLETLQAPILLLSRCDIILLVVAFF